MHDASYILTIDQGTSSTRASRYDLQGQCIQSAQYTISQFYPQAGFVEHDPDEIWSKTLKALREVIVGVNASQIVACGLTNQRETTVIWDKQTGICLAPAIVWQDRRTEAYCSSLREQNAMIQAKTGLLLDPYFSASKLHWLLQQIPQARACAQEGRLAFGTIDTFLIWKLTGGKSHFTDVTNASRTLLFNIHTLQWDDELLALFDIPRSILPTVQACDGYFGVIHNDILNAPIPIRGVIGDQQAALIGQGCVASGTIKATYGTGGFLMLNTGGTPVISNHKLLTTIAYQIKSKTAYALEGAIYQAGTVVQWLRDELKLIQSAQDTEALANSIDTNEGVYLIPSFTGLGAPHWLSTQGAAIVGLSRTSNPAHFARAALECVAYQTKDVLSCMEKDSNMKITGLRVDGGMTQNQWFLQFLSSLCQVQIYRSRQIEATSLGAFLLAAVACDAIDNLSSWQTQMHDGKWFLPENNVSEMEKNYQGWLQVIIGVKK